MSFEVFDVLDDWVVIAVRKENEAAQEVIREIKSLINDGIPHIDSVILKEINLIRQISTIEFHEGPPLFMQEA